MNKVTRFLAMTGLAFAASTTIGIGAATAATAAPAAPAAQSADSKGTAASKHRWGKDKVIGVYRSKGTCRHIGRSGEWKGSWDDYRCVPVRVGFHRLAWKLIAEYDRHHGRPGHWKPGHGFPGGGHGFPGGNPWDQKKR